VYSKLDFIKIYSFNDYFLKSFYLILIIQYISHRIFVSDE